MSCRPIHLFLQSSGQDSWIAGQYISIYCSSCLCSFGAASTLYPRRMISPRYSSSMTFNLCISNTRSAMNSDILSCSSCSILLLSQGPVCCSAAVNIRLGYGACFWDPPNTIEDGDFDMHYLSTKGGRRVLDNRCCVWRLIYIAKTSTRACRPSVHDMPSPTRLGPHELIACSIDTVSNDFGHARPWCAWGGIARCKAQ